MLLAVLVSTAFLALPATAWNYGDVVPVSLAVRHGEPGSRRHPLAAQYAPRFGVRRVVTIPAFHSMHRKAPASGGAAPVAAADETPEHMKVFTVPKGTAVQFHFAPIKFKTAWIPLDKASTDFGGNNLRLAHLTITFTYRHGVFADVATVAYERRYARFVEDLAVEYVWREEKQSDPDRGVIVAYCFCFVMLIAVALRVSSPSRFAAVGRVMAMRHRDD